MDIKYRIAGILSIIIGIIFAVYVVIPLGSFENLLYMALAETMFLVTGFLLVVYGVNAKYL